MRIGVSPFDTTCLDGANVHAQFKKHLNDEKAMKGDEGNGHTL